MTIWVRGDRVRHISPDMVGASRGTVLASFGDIQGQPCTAVQWDGGCIGVTRTKWLDCTLPTSTTGVKR